MPGVWAMTQFDATKRFLSAQNHGVMPMITQIVTAIIQIVCCYFFIIELQWGILGAAVATNITYISNMVLCDFWIAFHSEGLYKDMWLPWARSSLEGLGTFFEYGLPCAMIECSHWWVLELLIFLAGYISVEDFQAQTVVINMYGLIFMVPLGLSYTISSLVGTNLAQGKYHQAIRFSVLGFIYGQFLTLVFCILLGTYGHKIIGYFAYKESTIVRIQQCLVAVDIFMVLDSSFGLLMGVVKGLGQQNMAAIWTLLSQFAIGIPLAAFFAYESDRTFGIKDKYMGQIRGLVGLYVGFNIALALLNILLAILIFSLDWHKI